LKKILFLNGTDLIKIRLSADQTVFIQVLLEDSFKFIGVCFEFVFVRIVDAHAVHVKV
jgi:hypothetical protein